MTPAQCRAARGWLNLSQTELAAAAGTAVSTVKDFEGERRKPIANNLGAIQTALEAQGVVFVSGEGTSGISVRGK